MIMIFGEITTSATVNYEAVIRETLREIGYDDPAKGMDYKTVNVIVAIEEQSPDIAQGWYRVVFCVRFVRRLRPVAQRTSPPHLLF